MSSENRKPLVDVANFLGLQEGNKVYVEQNDGVGESYIEIGGDEVSLWYGTAAALAASANDVENDFEGESLRQVAEALDVKKNVIDERLASFDSGETRQASIPGDTAVYELDGVEQHENHDGYREWIVFEDAVDDMADTRIELPAVGLSELGENNLRRKGRQDLQQAKYNPLAASRPADYLGDEAVTPEELDEPLDIVSLLVKEAPEDLDIYAYEEGDGVNLSTEIDGEPVDVPPEMVLARLNSTDQILMEKKTREKMVARDVDSAGLLKNFNYKEDAANNDPERDKTFY
ncbi:MAG: hypothetical protein ABEJ83_04015 [Candidatus Nanohaloarchaea archaeon]